MNSIMEKQYPVLEIYLGMRNEVIEALGDEELGFRPENCPSFGELCLQIGEWQQAYIDGFKNFEQDFDWKHPDPGIQSSVDHLAEWNAEMDAELKQVVAAIPDEDVQSKRIDRGGWTASVTWNLDIFKECLVIFCSKSWVYFNLMGKALPESIGKWLN